MPRSLATLVLAVFAACAPSTKQLALLGGVGQGLSRVTSDKEQEFGPVVSPDGRTVLFDTRYVRSGNSAVIGVDPSSGARRTMFTSSTSKAQETAWSPDGRFFVYTSNSTGAWSLVRSVSNSPNAAVAIIVSGEMAPIISRPSLSPDGRRVAFSTRIRESWQVAVSGIDGSGFTLMGEGSQPAWSPEGSRLAFVRAAGRYAQIFTMDAETGTDVTQVTTGESDNFDPAWSPTGHRLVFSSNRSGRKNQSPTYRKNMGDRTIVSSMAVFQLYAINPDGTGVIQLTDGNGMNVHPHWGRDGWIYFSSNQTGNFDIWRLRPTGELLPSQPVGSPPGSTP